MFAAGWVIVDVGNPDEHVDRHIAFELVVSDESKNVELLFFAIEFSQWSEDEVLLVEVEATDGLRPVLQVERVADGIAVGVRRLRKRVGLRWPVVVVLGDVDHRAVDRKLNGIVVDVLQLNGKKVDVDGVLVGHGDADREETMMWRARRTQVLEIDPAFDHKCMVSVINGEEIEIGRERRDEIVL